MKKIFLYTCLALVFSMISLSFNSCGDDEPSYGDTSQGSGNGNNNTGDNNSNNNNEGNDNNTNEDEGNMSSSYLSLLLNEEGQRGFWGDNKYTFVFVANGEIAYFEDSGKNIGSLGLVSLNAEGKFSLSGSIITATYDDIFWEGYNTEQGKNLFPGWSFGGKKTVKYTIESLDSKKLVMTSSDGIKYYLEPY